MLAKKVEERVRDDVTGFGKVMTQAIVESGTRWWTGWGQRVIQFFAQKPKLYVVGFGVVRMELHANTLKVLHPQPSRGIVKRFGERVSKYPESSARLKEFEKLVTHIVISLGKVRAVPIRGL
jgi:hypothetical protein